MYAFYNIFEGELQVKVAKDNGCDVVDFKSDIYDVIITRNQKSDENKKRIEVLLRDAKRLRKFISPTDQRQIEDKVYGKNTDIAAHTNSNLVSSNHAPNITGDDTIESFRNAPPSDDGQNSNDVTQGNAKMIETVSRINESDAREQHAVTKTEARRDDRQGEGREEKKLRLLFAHYSPQPIDTENTVGRLLFGEWGHALNDMFMKNRIYGIFMFVMFAFSWVVSILSLIGISPPSWLYVFSLSLPFLSHGYLTLSVEIVKQLL